MKYINLPLIAGIGLCFALSACAGNSIKATSDNNTHDAARIDNSISSRQAYERGISAGRYATSLKPNSPEREKALVEIHGMVSSLRRNGFSQSANDFQKGVDFVLGSSKAK